MKKFLLFSVIVLLSSCAYNQKIEQISKKLNAIENTTKQNQADLNVLKPKVVIIEEKISSIENKITQPTNATIQNKPKKTVVEAQLDNSTKDSILQKIPSADVVFGTRASAQKKTQKSIVRVVKNNDNIKSLTPPCKQALDLYDKALSKYMDRDFKGALSLFLEFLQNYPNTTLEPNALFWVGNAYYNLEEYNKAIENFENIISNYPKKPTSEGGKTDAAYFMLYKVYKALGNKQEALRYLLELKKYYPINPYFEFRGVKR